MNPAPDEIGLSYPDQQLQGTMSVNDPDLEMPPDSDKNPPSPITFASMGVPAPSRLQDSVIGKIRPLNDTTVLERTFSCLMLISILTVAGFTIYRVVIVDNSDSDFTMGLVLLVQAGFCLVYLIDGILRERPSEIFILCIASVVIVIYLVVNYVEGSHTDVKLARMVIAACLGPFLVVMGLKIAWQYHVSKKIIFRTVGADPLWQAMLHRLLVFQDLLKFDLQLGGSMVILILTSGIAVTTRDTIVLAVGAPLTVAWFLVGYYAMPSESKPWSIVFAIFSPAEIAYIIYKFYMIQGYIADNQTLASATILVGAMALATRCVVMVAFAIVYRNFGKGLKEQMKS